MIPSKTKFQVFPLLYRCFYWGQVYLPPIGQRPEEMVNDYFHASNAAVRIKKIGLGSVLG